MRTVILAATIEFGDVLGKQQSFAIARLYEVSEAALALDEREEGDGKKFFKEVCCRDLEGIVAKPKLGIYKDDGNAWLKVKNRSYSQAEGRHELLTRKGRS